MKARLIDVELELPQPLFPRSEGVHVSGIIRCIATEYGILKPETAEELSLTDVRTITNKTAILRICMGLAWEEWYIPQIPNVVDHPGEMKVDGIYMTHDGESVDVIITLPSAGLQLICHEVKCTWKSINTVGNLDTKASWMWLTQIKAYCKGLGTRFACLHIYYVNGDYRRPLEPQLQVWEIEFEQEEIDETWADLTEYCAQRLEIEGRDLI